MLAFKSDKPAYRIFNTEGKDVKYGKMLEEMETADVVFFGELHNNPICHWLQIELTRDLYEKKDSAIMLGAEMFEADNQLILNEYIEGKISEKNYKKEAKLWPNYATDYAPLVEFAKEHQIPFIATNIPRRYASVVYSKGFEGLDSLSAEARSYIAPLPVDYDPELKGYRSMLEEMEGMVHANDNLPKAQAIKDATMAYSIAGALEKGTLFIHYNGTYHSNDYEGIIWYLNNYKPGLKIVSIASVEQEDIENLEEEYKNKADYIIVIPDRMTKTH
ncbi:MAG: iron-regulated protein [Marinilabiliales bacterium]|nr:MAG: iron-regulated protein [Marinilabiliales bacterium]